jgi:hypothetical protein
MIPTIQIDEAGFSEVAARDVEREVSDGVRLAQACIIEEILGAVFGSITLWYLVSSIAGLA